MVCIERTVGSKIILDQAEAHFDLLGDSFNLGAR
jgi:hypothetical protein